jgi:hypothetical protein
MHSTTCMQAYFLVADDIMDKSITRRGQPCWYRAEGVGLIAINDGILLECLLYFVLRKHLRGHAAYPHLLDLFLETTHQTAHGQLLDLITAPVGVPDLSRFSLERCACRAAVCYCYVLCAMCPELACVCLSERFTFGDVFNWFQSYNHMHPLHFMHSGGRWQSWHPHIPVSVIDR